MRRSNRGDFFKLNTLKLSPKDAGLAGDIIKNGGIVAIPTETVYGLAASALNPCAIKKIFAAKGRPQDNPLIVHICSVDQLDGLCRDIPPEAFKLAEKFWPGPLTMVLRKSTRVPEEVSAGLDTVAIRFPAHPVALDVIRAAGVPLAAPSANVSGSPSPTSAAHVFADLNGRIDAVIDGGECSVGIESTVISLAHKPPRLLRPGGITREQLCEVLAEIEIDKAVNGKISDNEKVSSPGMKYRHYAPSRPLKAICGKGEKTALYILSVALPGDAVICYNNYEHMFGAFLTFPYGDEHDERTLAHGLFSALRKADVARPERIFIQCPDERGIALAVSDRIKKAAGFDVVYV